MKARNLVLIFLGVIAFLLAGRYNGPQMEIVRAYGGNITVSFAVYFNVTNVVLRLRFRKLATAGIGLAAVDLFEATDGFKVMSNVYDPADYLANAAGIALGLLADAATSGIVRPRPVESGSARGLRPPSRGA